MREIKLPNMWHKDMNCKEAQDLAYWERNMLALYICYISPESANCGWYYHDDETSYNGWARVISINNGSITFHVPDDFDLGSLKQIKNNYDGHSSAAKWYKIWSVI